MTTQDAANEVVRAAVEWHKARCLAFSDMRRKKPQCDLSIAAHRLQLATQLYLDANLPDSAQHPTPNPG